ncbi:MAG: 30S ribosomal protein S21, partial [Chloroflexota bacterium]
MAFVALNEGESIESLLRRFRNSVARSGLLRELKDRRFFRSKAEKARIAQQHAARRRRRRQYPHLSMFQSRSP